MIKLTFCVELSLNLSLEINITVASLTPADKLTKSTLAIPLTTSPTNVLFSTMTFTVPFALSDSIILADALFG